VQDIHGATLQNILSDKRIQTAAFQGPQIGTVVSATATTVMFTIATYHPHVALGPAPYPRPARHSVTLTASAGSISPGTHTHDVGPPPVGTTCLVMFVGAGADQPYVVAFYGWPT
jgi:hypothetical protein